MLSSGSVRIGTTGIMSCRVVLLRYHDLRLLFEGPQVSFSGVRSRPMFAFPTHVIYGVIRLLTRLPFDLTL